MTNAASTASVELGNLAEAASSEKEPSDNHPEEEMELLSERPVESQEVGVAVCVTSRSRKKAVEIVERRAAEGDDQFVVSYRPPSAASDEGDGEHLEESPLLEVTLEGHAEDAELVEGDSDTARLIDDQESSGDAEVKHQSSIPGASFNFINSIIGAGIIGIPASLREAGFLPGLILLGLVGVLTDYTVILLVKNGELAKKYSYQEMVRHTFGKIGLIYLTIIQFLFPLFAMIGYTVIVGDTLSRATGAIFEAANAEVIGIIVDERFIKVVMVALVMMPISLFRNISRLEKFSAVAIVFITFIVVVTVYEAVAMYCTVRCLVPSCCSSVVASWIISPNVVQAVGVMAFAYVCHHNTFLIYSSLRNRTVKRFAVVSHLSVSVSFVFCLVLGVAGFITFLEETRGDLLNNYCLTDWVANAARYSYSIVIMLTYPIECFVTREVLEISLSSLPEEVISWIPNKTIKKAFHHFLYFPRHKSFVRHIILTLFLVLLTLGVGLTTSDLEWVLAFNGCFNATPLAFILPTACYLRLSPSKFRSADKLIALGVCLFGGLVMIIGTVQAILTTIESFSNEAMAINPDYCSLNATNVTYCSLDNQTVPLCDCKQLFLG